MFRAGRSTAARGRQSSANRTPHNDGPCSPGDAHTDAAAQGDAQQYPLQVVAAPLSRPGAVPAEFTDLGLRPGTSSGGWRLYTIEFLSVTIRVRLVSGLSAQRSQSKTQRPRRKQAWPHRGHRSMHVAAGTAKNVPRPKGRIKSFSAPSAPRSAFSAFSQEDIPAPAAPRFTPGRDIHAEAANQGQPARHTQQSITVKTWVCSPGHSERATARPADPPP
jgi:hypothetical protein